MAAAMSFGAAVELMVIMPLSWLPLVSDYTTAMRKTFASDTREHELWGDECVDVCDWTGHGVV